jgi:nucleoside-diphosphate-sugar epimerase
VRATALADVRFSRNLDRSFAQTNRLRTEGTDALLAAAREAGVRRFVAQSFASLRYAREGGPVKTEDDPLDVTPVAGTRETNAAMCYLDEAVAARLRRGVRKTDRASGEAHSEARRRRAVTAATAASSRS